MSKTFALFLKSQLRLSRCWVEIQNVSAVAENILEGDCVSCISSHQSTPLASDEGLHAIWRLVVCATVLILQTRQGVASCVWYPSYIPHCDVSIVPWSTLNQPEVTVLVPKCQMWELFADQRQKRGSLSEAIVGWIQSVKSGVSHVLCHEFEHRELRVTK